MLAIIHGNIPVSCEGCLSGHPCFITMLTSLRPSLVNGKGVTTNLLHCLKFSPPHHHTFPSLPSPPNSPHSHPQQLPTLLPSAVTFHHHIPTHSSSHSSSYPLRYPTTPYPTLFPFPSSVKFHHRIPIHSPPHSSSYLAPPSPPPPFQGPTPLHFFPSPPVIIV